MPIILSANGVPLFFPTLFTTIELRPHLKNNSISARLRDVQHLLLWEEKGEGRRDLIREIALGKFPTEHEIEQIAEHCSYHHIDIRRWYELKSTPGISRNGDVGLLPVVSGKQKADRLRTAASYYEFSAKAVLKERDDFDALKIKVK